MTMIEVLRENSPLPHLTNEQFGNILDVPEKFSNEIRIQMNTVQLSDEVSKFVLKCLSYNKDARPSFQQIVAELEFRVKPRLEKKISENHTSAANVNDENQSQHTYEYVDPKSNHSDQIAMVEIHHPYENVQKLAENKKSSIDEIKLQVSETNEEATRSNNNNNNNDSIQSNEEEKKEEEVPNHYQALNGKNE